MCFVCMQLVYGKRVYTEAKYSLIKILFVGMLNLGEIIVII